MTFEEPGTCNRYSKASNKVASGKAKAKDLERERFVRWMATYLSAADTLMVDKFGRAHIFRCSDDPALADDRITSNFYIGEGEDAVGIFMMMEFPIGAGACPLK